MEIVTLFIDFFIILIALYVRLTKVNLLFFYLNQLKSIKFYLPAEFYMGFMG